VSLVSFIQRFPHWVKYIIERFRIHFSSTCNVVMLIAECFIQHALFVIVIVTTSLIPIMVINKWVQLVHPSRASTLPIMCIFYLPWLVQYQKSWIKRFLHRCSFTTFGCTYLIFFHLAQGQWHSLLTINSYSERAKSSNALTPFMNSSRRSLVRLSFWWCIYMQ